MSTEYRLDGNDEAIVTSLAINRLVNWSIGRII
jgi:hypothetical protein